MQSYIFLILTMALSTSLFGARYYVTPVGDGDGSSWSQATADLSGVLQKSVNGDEVWVAIGVYIPSYTGDRSSSFILKDGVHLLGGFEGFERSPDQRDEHDGLSILSGELGANGAEDNSYSVLYSENLTEKALIDGFIICGGNSDFDYSSIDTPLTCGGAWYNKYNGDNGQGWPVIRNVSFEYNTALYGAAIYAEIRDFATFRARFEDCNFANNTAHYNGGAFCLNGDFNDAGSIDFEYCVFRDNTAYYGGALCVNTEVEKPVIKVLNCIFNSNSAILRGGAIYCPEKINSHNVMELKESEFKNNTPRNIN